jgi:hypothetical protein
MAKIIIENQKQLNRLIRKNVIEVIREILNDPDFGLELRDWVKKRLRKKPKKLIPFEEIKKKYL